MNTTENHHIKWNKTQKANITHFQISIEKFSTQKGGYYKKGMGWGREDERGREWVKCIIKCAIHMPKLTPLGLQYYTLI